MMRAGIKGKKGFPKTHGGKGSPEYSAWCAMKTRCTNSKIVGFDNWGGRGITISERWISNFKQFLADMGPMPSRGYELDRYPDNDGNYAPGNCRWATKSENRKRKRNAVLITANGITLSQADWARLLGLNKSTIQERRKVGLAPELIVAPKNSQQEGLA